MSNKIENNSQHNNNINYVNEYKDIDRNEIILPTTNFELRTSPEVKAEQGKQILIKQIKLEYQISDFIANRIIELRENKDECIEYIKNAIKKESWLIETYCDGIYQIISKFNFLEPDINVFRDNENLFKIQKILPVESDNKVVPHPEESSQPEVKPEVKPVKEEKQVEKPESEDEQYLMIKTNNNDVQFALEFTGKEFLLYLIYKGKTNMNSIKIDKDILTYNEKTNKNISNWIKQITKGEIKGITSTDLVNQLFSMLGEELFVPLQKMITAKNKKIHESKSINYDSLFENYEFSEDVKTEIIEIVRINVNDGNTKEYIIKQIAKFGMKIFDMEEIIEVILDLKLFEMTSVSQDEYFIDENKMYRLNVPMVANVILNNYHMFSTGKKDIYVYRDGVYLNDGVLTIQRAVNRILGAFVKDEFREEVIKYIEYETKIDIKNWVMDKNIINLNNGLYNIETDEFTSHTPELKSIIRVPITYNPDAKCPNIDKFLSEVIPTVDIPTAIEFMGYCMIPDTRMQKATMIYGGGKNGKSVFLKLLKALIGKDNIYGASLQKLSTDKFGVAGLFGKLLNISPDIPNTKLTSDSTFKMLVGGDDINGEKKYKDALDFENISRLIFSANQLPEPSGNIEDNYAYFRRWLLIGFPYSFDGKKDNKNLISTLITEDEKSGFLNQMIKGVQTILKNGSFSNERTTEEIERMYKVNVDPVGCFFKECVNHGCSNAISKQEMYDVYVDWCSCNSAIVKPYNSFCSSLLNDIGVKDYRDYNNDRSKKVAYWDHVGFVNEFGEKTIRKLNLAFTDEEVAVMN